MNDRAADKPERVREAFAAIGGRFVGAPERLPQSLDRIRAVVFDWDGVFNSGAKGALASGFSEPDSMGTNMLRYGLWRQYGSIPCTAIITGADNPVALEFAAREHFSAVYSGIGDKGMVLAHLCREHGIDRVEVAVIFDDINDLAMARDCGARFMVSRRASPMLTEFVTGRAACDYVTGARGDAHAVREVCELMLAFRGQFDDVVESRVALDDDYRNYFRARQAVPTRRFESRGGAIVERDD